MGAIEKGLDDRQVEFDGQGNRGAHPSMVNIVAVMESLDSAQTMAAAVPAV